MGLALFRFCFQFWFQFQFCFQFISVLLSILLSALLSAWAPVSGHACTSLCCMDILLPPPYLPKESTEAILVNLHPRLHTNVLRLRLSQLEYSVILCSYRHATASSDSGMDLGRTQSVNKQASRHATQEGGNGETQQSIHGTLPSISRTSVP